MIQIRFNGYYLRLLATPAKTHLWLGQAGEGVKTGRGSRESHADSAIASGGLGFVERLVSP
jgi:hypothetical protein